MARLRNISDDTLEVRVVGRAVKPDELIDVPDDVYEAHVWPESVWRVTAEATESKSDTKKKADAKP